MELGPKWIISENCLKVLGSEESSLVLQLVTDGSVFRPDGHQNNLRSAAYEALMEIVKNSAKDCYPAVQKTTLVIMERLQQVLQMEVRWLLLLYSTKYHGLVATFQLQNSVKATEKGDL